MFVRLNGCPERRDCVSFVVTSPLCRILLLYISGYICTHTVFTLLPWFCNYFCLDCMMLLCFVPQWGEPFIHGLVHLWRELMSKLFNYVSSQTMQPCSLLENWIFFKIFLLSFNTTNYYVPPKLLLFTQPSTMHATQHNSSNSRYSIQLMQVTQIVREYQMVLPMSQDKICCNKTFFSSGGEKCQQQFSLDVLAAVE